MAAHVDPHGHPPPHGYGAAGVHVHEPHPAHQHHFETMEQQAEAATLGMWLFLATEVLFFGGLFTTYLIYRMWYPAAWSEGSLELDIVLGSVNTVVLITSSLTMALAVRAAQTGHQRPLIRNLILTIILGLVFLVIKFFEYKHKFDVGHVPGPNFHFEGAHAGQVELFITLYFAMTGLHALHMVIGLGIMSVILWMAMKQRFSPAWYTPVELAGLYWHFVDIVWIFLFPLLYLVDRAGHYA